MRTQLNVRVSKSIARSVTRDKKNSAGTNDIVAEVALENWFSRYTPEERSRFYHAHTRRPYSRAKAFQAVSQKLDTAYAIEKGTVPCPAVGLKHLHD